jgi:hypothetical protein
MLYLATWRRVLQYTHWQRERLALPQSGKCICLIPNGLMELDKVSSLASERVSIQSDGFTERVDIVLLFQHTCGVLPQRQLKTAEAQFY